MDDNKVYWIIRGSQGSDLFVAPMMLPHSDTDKAPFATKVNRLQQPDIQGSLCYYSNRVFWLRDNVNAVTSDLRGRNVASIKGKGLSGVIMINVMDASLYDLPSG